MLDVFQTQSKMHCITETLCGNPVFCKTGSIPFIQRVYYFLLRNLEYSSPERYKVSLTAHNTMLNKYLIAEINPAFISGFTCNNVTVMVIVIMCSMILIFCLFSNYVILATFLTKIRGLEYLSGTMYARLKIILAGSDIVLGLSLGDHCFILLVRGLIPTSHWLFSKF